MSNNRSNLYYVRHDENNVVVNPQPGFTTAQSPLVGAGWSARDYRNYNGDYVRHDEEGNVGIVSSYVRHDENNNPVVP